MPMKHLMKTAVFLCYTSTGTGIYLESEAGPWT